MIWWTGFPSTKVDEIWERAEPLLKRGFEVPELAEPFYDKCKSGQAQIWGVFDDEQLIAAFLTEVVNIGPRKVCNIISVGGSRVKEWLHLISIIELWAKSQDCTAMRHANCRKGWIALLKDYHTTRIILEKEL